MNSIRVIDDLKQASWFHAGKLNRVMDASQMRQNLARLTPADTARDSAHCAGLQSALYVNSALRYPFTLADNIFGTQRCTGAVADKGILTHLLCKPVRTLFYLASPWCPKSHHNITRLYNQAFSVINWAAYQKRVENYIRFGTLPVTYGWTLAKATILGATYGIGYVSRIGSIAVGLVDSRHLLETSTAHHASPRRCIYNNVTFADLTPVEEIDPRYLFVSSSNFAFDIRELAIWLSTSLQSKNPHTNSGFSESDINAIYEHPSGILSDSRLAVLRQRVIEIISSEDNHFILEWLTHLDRATCDAAVRGACTLMQQFLSDCSPLRRVALQALLRAADGTSIEVLLAQIVDNPSRRSILTEGESIIPDKVSKSAINRERERSPAPFIIKWEKSAANFAMGVNEKNARLCAWIHPFVNYFRSENELINAYADKASVLPLRPAAGDGGYNQLMQDVVALSDRDA